MNTPARLPAFALAAVFTLAMLLGVHALARVEAGAAVQIAADAAPAHS